MKNRIPRWLGPPKLLLLLFLLTGMEEWGGCPLLTIKNFDEACDYRVYVRKNDEFFYPSPPLAPGAEDLTILPKEDRYSFLVSREGSCVCDEDRIAEYSIKDDAVIGIKCLAGEGSGPDAVLDPAQITIKNDDPNCGFFINYRTPFRRTGSLDPSEEDTFLIITQIPATFDGTLLCARASSFLSPNCGCKDTEICVPNATIANLANSTKRYSLTCMGFG